ncbi:hypothetical protein INT48_005704 [Thamnidium elegans]|uniref:Uncharacterized protein n=1 Tax=Thamnidium elegans TaxID=101142 RepID=A0A8H7VSB2_9FUNG|nr:hypothetical protein INT48_005704 [Thamnidium elegans]
MSASNNQSTSPSGTNTTVSTQVDKATAPVAPDANNTDDFDNDQLLLEFDNLDSILSDEVYLGDNVDVDMGDVSVFSSAAADPLKGIERNLKVLQRRILDLSTAIISQGQVAPPQLVTELRSLRAVLDELLEIQRLLAPVPVVVFEVDIYIKHINNHIVNKNFHISIIMHPDTLLLNTEINTDISSENGSYF